MCFSGALAVFRARPALPYALRMATKPAAEDRERPRILTRSTVLPALGIGLVTALLAAQEHAPALIAVVVGLAVAGVVIGMIAIKRALYGD
jgi:hypothetical protein